MSRQCVRFSRRLILFCVLIAGIASSIIAKRLLLPSVFLQSSDIEPTSVNRMPIPSSSVVTRPNPDVIGYNKDEPAKSSIQLLQKASKGWTYIPSEAARYAEDTATNKSLGPESRDILHHSFTDIDHKKELTVVPYGNGFVDGITRAFQQDPHLVLQPDDVWLAITIQFSFYINAHAEELRKLFVEHDGKEPLVINLSPQTISPTLDLADFSTTIDNDISVAAMVMMATTKAYFEYVIMLDCGFPSVTLLSERDDWVDIFERLRVLATFGDEPAEWGKLLMKVVEKMIETFDRPHDENNKAFWMKAIHRTGAEASGRGVESLSGWITAFCFWDSEGNMIHQFTDEEIKIKVRSFNGDGDEDRRRLVINDVVFPIIGAEIVPQGVVSLSPPLSSSSFLALKTLVATGALHKLP
ncbi:hypothetical protein V8C35DRAFT_324617 [Trichoderma chlorosporum]